MISFGNSEDCGACSYLYLHTSTCCWLGGAPYTSPPCVNPHDSLSSQWWTQLLEASAVQLTWGKWLRWFFTDNFLIEHLKATIWSIYLLPVSCYLWRCSTPKEWTQFKRCASFYSIHLVLFCPSQDIPATLLCRIPPDEEASGHSTRIGE